MSVKENITKLRDLSGLTQEEIASIAGVSRAAVSLWEIGKSEPRMGAVQKLADHFHIRKANIIEDGGMDNAYAAKDGSICFHTVGSIGPLTSEEMTLVSLYRESNQQGRAAIMAVAQVSAGDMEGESQAGSVA